MPLVFKASSTKGALFRRFYSELLCSDLSWQIEVSLHWTDKFVFSKFPRFYFGWKPPFAYTTFMQDRWWKSRWFKSKIWSMLFAAYIPVEQEVTVTVIMVAFSIFTRFWCASTHIQSKPSSNFALRPEPSPESRQQGGFTFVQGGLDNQIWQNFHWFIVFQFSIWGLEALFGGAKPTKAPPWRWDRLRHKLPKLVYKTCGYKRRGSYPIFERLIDVCSW